MKEFNSLSEWYSFVAVGILILAIVFVPYVLVTKLTNRLLMRYINKKYKEGLSEYTRLDLKFDYFWVYALAYIITAFLVTIPSFIAMDLFMFD